MIKNKNFTVILHMKRYNLDLLIQTAEQNDCIIDIEYYKKINVNRDIEICFICNCGNIYFKTMRRFIDNPLCQICTQNKSHNKAKQTNLIKYGCENPLQNEQIKQQIKQTNLIKYGCENPHQNIKVIEKTKQTNLERYGNTCNLLNDTVKEKIKQTNLIKYGHLYSFQNNEVKEKIKQTNLIKYGHLYSSQNNEVKEKTKQTNLIKYGYIAPAQNNEIKEKSKQTNIIKYGHENPMQNNEVKEKSKKTNLEKYGFQYPMQNAIVAENASKNSYKLKSYIFPCDNVIQCQGYEPFAFDILLQNGYTYNDIIVKKTEIPEIWYEKNDKKHRYFCDIYIIKEQRIIEVKSTWTYLKDKEDLQLKRQACIDNNYKFELWIFDRNANLIKEDEIED